MALTYADETDLRSRLRAMLDAAERKRRERLAIIVESTSERRDVGDVFEGVQRETDLTVSAATADEASVTIRRVMQALARMGAGTYGVCVDCGNDIAVSRLFALPFASRCIACQEALE
ncbi:MAG TPA: TraR/DksA C4-type zinc finger protein [Candidatus Paceibacterota bacterium]|nr:TraR/DksA C4-type zinc finger protein [Candidatus Paceibacterota bacterium]